MGVIGYEIISKTVERKCGIANYVFECWVKFSRQLRRNGNDNNVERNEIIGGLKVRNYLEISLKYQKFSSTTKPARNHW